ncbi:MAG: MBL fold metallo-hydrolase [Solirubrobacterales bacterium]|nr:MBL fold metallo-hydrolase [Solirubrobacterales bacterium]
MAGERHPDGVARVRAPNPSPMTLDGTNTYVAAGWAIDPGPDDEGHLAAVLAAAGGALEGVALTHAHPDHSAGAARLAELAGGIPVAAPSGDGAAGPFRSVATPGHAPDHVCLMLGETCFAGDLVMGHGSVFVGGEEGSLTAYLDSLARIRALAPAVLCPGHGPYVWDPAAKLDEYVAHRLDRERMLLAALADGARSTDDLLDRAWSDAPAALRPVAALTLAAHLDKLRAEGRLPDDMRE